MRTNDSPPPFNPAIRWLSLCLVIGGLGCASERRLAPGLVDRARAASAGQRWVEASELWGTLLEDAGGDDAQARFAFGEALHRAGESMSALRVLRAGEAPLDTDARYWKLVGDIHLELGQLRAAGAALTKVVTHHPEDRETLVTYGTALLDGERAHRGIAMCLRALRLDVGDGQLAQRVAQRCAELGRFGQEFEAWTLCLKAPNPPAEAFLGAALGPEVSEDQKGAWLYEAVRLDPQLGSAWRRIGAWHKLKDQPASAMRAYRRAVEVDPADVAACLELAGWSIHNGNCIQGRIWADQALAGPADEEQIRQVNELLEICD